MCVLMLLVIVVGAHVGLEIEVARACGPRNQVSF